MAIFAAHAQLIARAVLENQRDELQQLDEFHSHLAFGVACLNGQMDMVQFLTTKYKINFEKLHQDLFSDVFRRAEALTTRHCLSLLDNPNRQVLFNQTERNIFNTLLYLVWVRKFSHPRYQDLERYLLRMVHVIEDLKLPPGVDLEVYQFMGLSLIKLTPRPP
jgi:hypothetical protein